MTDNSYSGEQAYLCLLKNNCNCPVRLPIERGTEVITEDNPVVSENGIAYISALYDGPYDSFSHWCQHNASLAGGAVSIVADIDTGETRFYDGSQGTGVEADPSIYFTIPQLSLCKVTDFNLSKSMPVNEINELGQMYPDSIDEFMYDSIKINLDKVYVDKVKLESAGTDKNSPLLNQIGLSGMSLVELDEFVQTLEQNYYMAILYIPDMNPNTSHIAKSHILPCAKFSNVEIDVVNKRIISASISGKATYMRTLPRRVTYPYEQVSDFPSGFECEMYIENWSYDPGDMEWGYDESWASDYRSVGQIFEPSADKDVCSIAVRFSDSYTITDAYSDVFMYLYEDGGSGPKPSDAGSIQIGESVVVDKEDISQTGETVFDFPTHPTISNGTQYCLVMMTDDEPTEKHIIYYEPETPTGTGHYANGGAVYCADNTWTDIPDTPDVGWDWLNVDFQKDLWFRIRTVV